MRQQASKSFHPALAVEKYRPPSNPKRTAQPVVQDVEHAAVAIENETAARVAPMHLAEEIEGQTIGFDGMVHDGLRHVADTQATLQNPSRHVAVFVKTAGPGPELFVEAAD